MRAHCFILLMIFFSTFIQASQEVTCFHALLISFGLRPEVRQQGGLALEGLADSRPPDVDLSMDSKIEVGRVVDQDLEVAGVPLTKVYFVGSSYRYDDINGHHWCYTGGHLYLLEKRRGVDVAWVSSRLSHISIDGRIGADNTTRTISDAYYQENQGRVLKLFERAMPRNVNAPVEGRIA